MADLPDLISRLTASERDLLLGNCTGWGSWMYEAAEHLVSLGLGTHENGSIYFDTPLATEVIAALRSQSKVEPNE